MYTTVLYLLDKTYETDDVGNQVPTITKIKSYALKKSVASKEFYNAAAVGIKPTFEFQIRKSNYHDESFIEYESEEYKVIRTIDKSMTDIILVVEKKSGNK